MSTNLLKWALTHTTWHRNTAFGLFFHRFFKNFTNEVFNDLSLSTLIGDLKVVLERKVAVRHFKQ